MTALWPRLLLLLFPLLCTTAGAVNPNVKISQYGHTTWRVQDGTFQGSPTFITQTRDGYIWIGTRTGLLRFDGAKFERWEAIGGPTLPQTDVSILLGSSDGSLWIGLRNGLLRWKSGGVTRYPGFVSFITDIREAKDGSIWVTRSRTSDGRPLCRIGSDGAACYGKEQGIPFSVASQSMELPSGVLLAASTRLGIWKPNSFQELETPIPTSMAGLAAIADLVVNEDGSFWMGVGRAGAHLGLQRYTNGSWSPLQFGEFDSSKLSVTKLLLGPDGTLWVGTRNQGLYRVHGAKVDHYDVTDGLTANAVSDLFLDREGDLWVVTLAGIDMFHSLSVTTYSTIQGISSDQVTAVSVSPFGTIALGGTDGMETISPESSQITHGVVGMPAGQATSISYDHNGNLWAGINHDLYVSDGRSAKRLIPADGTQVGIVQQIIEDRDHIMWILAFDNNRRNRLFRAEGMRIQEEVQMPLQGANRLAAGPAKALYVGTNGGRITRLNPNLTTTAFGQVGDNLFINDLQVDTDGVVMAATASGLFRIDGDRTTVLSSANGLPCNRILQFLRTSNRDLWLYSDCGLIQVPAGQESKLKDPKYIVQSRLFDSWDGALPGAATFSPGSARSAEDILYFANDQVLQVFDTSNPGLNTYVPPVYVERVTGDRGAFLVSPEATSLPAGTRSVQVDYAGLSYVVPQKVHFRYRLDGWDKDWQEASVRRQAFYTNLSPGTYTFRVTACNNDGVWNAAGASMRITIQPAVYQTAWFRILFCLILFGLLYLLIALRMRSSAARISERWAERISERERIARELHDSFFQGIQGILLRVSTAARSLPGNTPARTSLEQVLDQSQEVMLTGRQLVQDLRKTGTAFTLLDGLETVGREFQSLYPIAFQTDSQGRQRPLNLQVADELCKVGREAISNAFRHSNASLIRVELDYDARNFGLTIKDNGQGIDETVMIDGHRTGHWGLPGMRERVARLGGSIRFESKQGDGTTVEIRVPAKRVYRGKRFRLRSWLRGIREGSSE